jgi:hypothetical protein
MTDDEKVLYFYERNKKDFATPNLNIAIARSETNQIKAKFTNINGGSYTKLINIEREE